MGRIRERGRFITPVPRPSVGMDIVTRLAESSVAIGTGSVAIKLVVGLQFLAAPTSLMVRDHTSILAGIAGPHYCLTVGDSVNDLFGPEHAII
jgi:hypothetical protein